MTSEHSHPSRHAKILLAAVIWEHFERQTMDGLNDELDEIVFGDLVTHVRGQQHWCFTVDEAGTHAQILAATLDLNQSFG